MPPPAATSARQEPPSRAPKRRPAIVAAGALLAADALSASCAFAGSLERAGDILSPAVPVAGLLISVAKDDKDGIVQLGATALTSTGVTQALKAATNDSAWGTRPNGGSYSFPSGHTSFAFAGAGYLHFRYGWEYGLPAAAVAAFVAYTRVDANKHHVRDVVAGSLVGYTSAFFLTDPQNKNVRITPIANFGQKPSFGLVAHIRF
jgi:hypothetical protein